MFVGGVLVEDKLTLQTDPVQWVNQSSQTIKDIHQVERETGGTSELGVYAKTGDVFSDEFVEFSHDFTQEQLRKYPKRLLTGSSIETAVGDIINDVPGASDIAPTGAEVKAAYDVAPKDLQRSAVAADGTAFNIVVPHGARLARGAARRSCASSATRPIPHPGSAPPRRAWRWSAWGCSTTSSPTASS